MPKVGSESHEAQSEAINFSILFSDASNEIETFDKLIKLCKEVLEEAKKEQKRYLYSAK